MPKRRTQRPKHKKKSSSAAVSKFGMRLQLPAELQLPSPIWADILASVSAHPRSSTAAARPAAGVAKAVASPATDVSAALAAIATNAWRARNKMVDPATGEPKDEMKRVYRHVEGIFETLKQIGVELVDPAGQPYDSGMALKVVSFEPTAGLGREEVIETIKPSVGWQGRLVQVGEVIVGTPLKN